MNVKIKIFSLLKKNAPAVIDYGRKLKKILLKRTLAAKRKNNQVITRQHLINNLLQAGLKSGDSVMVHSSLSKIGYVEGGAATVVDALLEVVGSTGNLLMPAFAHSTFSKYYLDSNPVFDINNSPSKAGAITEDFRKRKSTLRSFHPTDSVCASGPLADYFTNSHFGQLTPYNQFSPYFKLAMQQGKILNIGVPLNTSCTNLHTLEDAVDFKFPIYHAQIFEARMIDIDGREQRMKTKVHDPAYSEKRKPDELIPLFENEKVLTHVKIGEASAMLVDAKGLLDVMLKHYHKNGITMYTPHGSN